VPSTSTSLSKSDKQTINAIVRRTILNFEACFDTTEDGIKLRTSIYNSTIGVESEKIMHPTLIRVNGSFEKSLTEFDLRQALRLALHKVRQIERDILLKIMSGESREGIFSSSVGAAKSYTIFTPVKNYQPACIGPPDLIDD
jgi:hypothetical protein